MGQNISFDSSDHIAVLDIGRTNKKLLVYDMNLNQVDHAYATIEEAQTGMEYHEPLSAVTEWFLGALAEMARRYSIKVISISTYGATFVCLDGEGKVALPAMSGATDPGEAFHKAFDSAIGDPFDIHRRMATPRMPFLSGLSRGIYYVKEHYPEQFAQVRTILTLPNYYGFLLTGKTGIEPTYLGAHTGLWDFEHSRFSDMRERLGVKDLIPGEVSRPWDVLGTVKPEIARQTGLSGDVVVTMGIHDSNASLLPFLIKERENFMLVSTGSMCVVMNPSGGSVMREDELGEMVYFNLSAFGEPVKTALFVAGLEFDLYMGLLEGSHGRRDHPELNPGMLTDILGSCDEFVLPAVVPFGMYMHSPGRLIQAGRVYPLGDVFAGKSPEFLNNYERAYAVLILSMALHTRKAMQRAGMSPGKTVFIEGGFSHNALYAQLIAALFPESPVMLTDLNEATALGAAMLGLAAHEGLEPHRLSERFSMTASRVMPINLPGLNAYAEAFERNIMNCEA
jgi:sugar (pentulose or hexulose) kinase